MQKSQNLQDAFLNQARKDRLTVTMFLMNGFQLHGIVRGFDGFTVVLDIEGLDPKSSIRLIDFLAGALQVLGGELRRVTKTTFVLSPHAGGFSDEEDGIDG